MDQNDLYVALVVGALAAVVIIALGFVLHRSSVSHVDKGKLGQRLRSLLVVDGSKTIQKVVQLTFMEVCQTVETAETAAQGIHALETREFDLLLVDIHLDEEVGGYEVCRRAKAQRPDHPVVLFLGVFEPFRQRDFDDCGADALVRKPFDGNELLELAFKLLVPRP